MTANPLFSPDGAKLFFNFTEDRKNGWTTKYVEKTGSGWSALQSDGVLLKTSSSFTKSGKVYFSDYLSRKPWATGIYSAQYSTAGYSDAKALDAAINSPYIDYTPYISPDEAYLMFSSSRPSSDERMFLHISFKNSDGRWSPPRKMNDLIGFAGAARFPSISPDGKYLFFCGDDGNFYWADIKAIEKLKPAQESEYLNLQGAVLGEVIQHDAMMLNFHVPMYVDRLKQSGRVIPDQVNGLLAAARAANDKQDYHRAFRLYARAAGLASGESKVEQYEVAAAFRMFLNRAIFASGENITLAVRPLFTLGHPLANRYAVHVWLETEEGALAGSARALTISELKEYDFDYPADGLHDGVIAVGYRLTSPTGETLAELKQAVVVAKDVQHRLERLKEKFAAAKQKGGAALATLEYDIHSLERERESFDGNWQRTAHPFDMYLGRVNFIALGRPDGNTFPKFDARLRYPEDVAFAESLIDGLATDPDTLVKRSGDMAEAYRSAADGQLLRYRIYVPRGYDRARKYSLIAALHSGGGDSTYFEWEEHFTPPGQHPENRLKQLAQERGYIVVCPNGSSGTSLGERDDPEVVALIEKVREMYSIDPRRVFLTGWSVGASAAWRIAMQHPGLFGAFAPVGGEAHWLNRQNTEGAHNLPVLYSLTTSEVEGAKSTTGPAREFLPKFSQKEYPGTDHASVWAKALPDVFDFFDARTAPILAARRPLEVTYIANEGFVIQGGGKKVLIDAPVATIPPATGQTLKAITDARDPFNDVDLILVTHQHADHLDPASLIACLRSNPKARLIAPTQAVDLMRSVDGFAGIEKQIQEIRGEPGHHEQVRHNGIAADVLCLNHEHLPQVRNLAFAVELGGARFLHMGDAFIGDNEARLKSYPFEQAPIDLVFLNQYDRSPATQQFIARKIKPSRIVAMHVSPAELAEESDAPKIRAAYPHAIVFKQSMERRLLSLEVDFHNLSGDYLGQPLPGATPEVFARGIVSTDDLEHSAPSFSPDGNEVLWTANRPPGPDNKEWFTYSLTMQRENGRWSALRVTPLDGMPRFSPDDRRVYFHSREDIWVVEKQGDQWSEPRCLGLISRFPELKAVYMPSVTITGTLYFVGPAPGLKNDSGIYRTEFVNGEYTKPRLLPRNINLPPFQNSAPFIAPDESYLLFSSNRTGSLDDHGDLYISRRQADGSWTEPVSLGEPVNSPVQEVFPGLSPDGKYLFFCRYTPGHNNDVYWVSAATIPALHPVTRLPKEYQK